MKNNPIVGWDIGGAHLKAVLIHSDGEVLSVIQRACPLWRGLHELETAVQDVLAEMAVAPARHAITMTGELADIFPDRRSGVMQVTHVMQHMLSGQEIFIYGGLQGFLSSAQAPGAADNVASANWHASASFLARHHSRAIFIDIGSTTSDIIPLCNGRPDARGYSDADRLRHDELVYSGVVRTPVMAVASHLPFAGEWQRIAAEHFATMADVYRLTGELPEAYDMADTADGQGKTQHESARRLARMVGRDVQDASFDDWRTLAFAVRSQHLRSLQSAMERQLSRSVLPADAPFIGAGAGTFLVRELARVMNRPFVEAQMHVPGQGQTASWAGVCLPAYAVAWLLRQESPCH